MSSENSSSNQNNEIQQPLKTGKLSFHKHYLEQIEMFNNIKHQELKLISQKKEESVLSINQFDDSLQVSSIDNDKLQNQIDESVQQIAYQKSDQQLEFKNNLIQQQKQKKFGSFGANIQKKMEKTNNKKFTNTQQRDPGDMIISKQFRIFSKIRGMIMFFLDNTEFKRKQKLTDYHFQLIGDQCTRISNEQKNENQKDKKDKFKLRILVKNCYEKLKDFFYFNIVLAGKVYDQVEFIPLFLNFMNVVMTVLLLYLFTINMFQYGIDMSENWINYILLICLIIQLGNIKVNFNLAYYFKGKVVYKKNEIADHYKKTDFKYDFISLLAILYIIYDSSSYFSYIFQVIYFIKLYPVHTSINRLERQFLIIGDLTHYYSLFKMLVNAVMMCHWVAILFNLLSFYNINYNMATDTWQHVDNVQEQIWYIKYLYSMYWSIETMMLVGPHAYNSLEVLFTSIILFITVGIFAYFISNISMILEELHKSEKLYTQDFNAINSYMRKRNISKDLQARVRNYLEYYFTSHSAVASNEDVQIVLKKLPKLLKDDLMTEVNSGLIQQFPFIKEIFTLKTVNQIIPKLQERYFLPSEIIFKKGESENINLYFVKKGTIELICQDIYNKGQNPIISYVNQGQIVGLYSLFTNLAYRISARCVTACEIYSLSRDDLLDILKDQEEDFEHFHAIKHDLLLRDFSYKLNLQCMICQSKYHTEQNCNLVHYNPIKLQTIQKCNFSVEQQRKNIDRIRKDYFNPLSRQGLELLEDARDYCYDRPSLRQIMFQYLQKSEIENQEYLNDLSDADQDSILNDVANNYSNTQIDDRKLSIDAQTEKFSRKSSKVSQPDLSPISTKNRQNKLLQDIIDDDIEIRPKSRSIEIQFKIGDSEIKEQDDEENENDDAEIQNQIIQKKYSDDKQWDIQKQRKSREENSLKREKSQFFNKQDNSQIDVMNKSKNSFSSQSNNQIESQGQSKELDTTPLEIETPKNLLHNSPHNFNLASPSNRNQAAVLSMFSSLDNNQSPFKRRESTLQSNQKAIVRLQRKGSKQPQSGSYILNQSQQSQQQIGLSNNNMTISQNLQQQYPIRKSIGHQTLIRSQTKKKSSLMSQLQNLEQRLSYFYLNKDPTYQTFLTQNKEIEKESFFWEFEKLNNFRYFKFEHNFNLILKQFYKFQNKFKKMKSLKSKLSYFSHISRGSRISKNSVQLQSINQSKLGCKEDSQVQSPNNELSLKHINMKSQSPQQQ